MERTNEIYVEPNFSSFAFYSYNLDIDHRQYLCRCRCISGQQKYRV
ncbi:unnamed protein product [Amoebophrya sp. A25]|nr:unnamed protein product [Amoebophrya sp. A25]|eukprot:GSA25T00022776001.1